MLNPRRERQGYIHTFKLSNENIKHGPFVLWWSTVFDFQCKTGKEWANKKKL